jgi:hypothetical protein
VNNGVLLLRDFLNWRLRRAVEIADAIVTACLREFRRITEHGSAEERGLGVPARGQMLTFVRGLDRCLCGALTGHSRSRRYLAPDLGRRPRTGPSRRCERLRHLFRTRPGRRRNLATLRNGVLPQARYLSRRGPLLAP